MPPASAKLVSLSLASGESIPAKKLAISFPANLTQLSLSGFDDAVYGQTAAGASTDPASF